MSRKSNFDELEGKAKSQSVDYFGIQGPIGKSDRTVLVIDDNTDVIHNFLISMDAENDYGARFFFFRITDEDGARSRDLIQWITDNRPLSGIFIDGELEGQSDGNKIAKKIRKIPGMRYQALAILTANLSWVHRTHNLPDDLPIMLKFEQKASDTLKRLGVELKSLHNIVRNKLWSDLHFKVAMAQEKGKSTKQVAELAGDFLIQHDGCKAWYLRELKDKKLHAIACKDTYGAGEDMVLDESATFLNNLVYGEREQPWLAIKSLRKGDVGPRKNMLGDRCIAAALSRRDANRKGAFTAYRDKDAPEFDDRDARELHHVALQIRAAMEKETQSLRQESTANTIEAIMMAKSSIEATDNLRQFVHDEINFPKLTKDDKKATKTTIRLFKRGNGKLKRWGNESLNWRSLGHLGWGVKAANINITDNKSVYARVIRNGKTERNDDRDTDDRGFVSTAKGVISYLTVPIKHGDAVIGAVNMEADFKSAYNKHDEKLVEAMAKTTAASIFRQRADRFMEQLARLAAQAVRPSAENNATPEAILNEAAEAVYLLCGYSNLILVEPPKIKDNRDTPWTIVAGWRGGENLPEKDNKEKIKHWKQQLNKDWEDSYLRRVIETTSPRKNVFFTNNNEAISRDDGPGNTRPYGRPTMSMLVIRIGAGKNPNKLFSLLFEQPNPIPKSYHPVLEAFADFMSAVFEADQHKISRFGESLLIQQHEARIGRRYGQLRHTIIGKLAKINSRIERKLLLKTEPVEILADIQTHLIKAERAVKNTRVFIKVPEIEPCNPSEIWDTLIDDGNDRALACNVELLPAEGKECVMADKDILTTVLTNLLDNALIHGKGTRTIRMKIESGAICVGDDGDSIDEDNVRHLFEAGFTTSSDGSGQGLYLTREQVHDMNGHLSFERKGDLNCFIITLEEAFS